MTKEKLATLHVLRREITRTKKRMAKIKQNGFKSNQSKAAFEKLDAQLDKYLAEIYLNAAEILEYINGIEDLTVREIFMLRYFDDVRSWQKIAFEIGEYDESYVRKKHDRFLKAANKRRQNSLAAK